MEFNVGDKIFDSSISINSNGVIIGIVDRDTHYNMMKNDSSVYVVQSDRDIKYTSMYNDMFNGKVGHTYYTKSKKLILIYPIVCDEYEDWED